MTPAQRQMLSTIHQVGTGAAGCMPADDVYRLSWTARDDLAALVAGGWVAIVAHPSVRLGNEPVPAARVTEAGRVALAGV